MIYSLRYLNHVNWSPRAWLSQGHLSQTFEVEKSNIRSCWPWKWLHSMTTLAEQIPHLHLKLLQPRITVSQGQLWEPRPLYFLKLGNRKRRPLSVAWPSGRIFPSTFWSSTVTASLWLKCLNLNKITIHLSFIWNRMSCDGNIYSFFFSFIKSMIRSWEQNLDRVWMQQA